MNIRHSALLYSNRNPCLLTTLLYQDAVLHEDEDENVVSETSTLTLVTLRRTTSLLGVRICLHVMGWMMAK